MRKKRTFAYTVKDFYKYYIDNLEENSPYEVDYKTYRSILEDYFKYLRDEVIEEGNTIKIPGRLGQLSIIKQMPAHWNKNSLCVDFKATAEYGKTIYHLNEHSNGFKYRFRWNKTNLLIRNSAAYQLVMTRANKRRLAQIIKNRERDYVEL